MSKPSMYWDSFLLGLKPDEILNVSEWADKYRKLSSKASAEAGQWRTERTPYLKEIMDTLSPHCSTEEIVFMKGAQVGGSESGFNWIGYVIDHSPGPMLMVQPRVEDAKKVSKQRIDPMIEECDVLRAKVKPSRSRDSGNTLLSKEFPGGMLILAGANSAAGLRSMPIRYLFLDEADSYELDLQGEGSPIDLAKARTRTFNRRKIFIVSTPTIAGQSAIETAFEDSDRRYFQLPCPHCNHYQALKFSNLAWEKGKPETVNYACVFCGELIPEHHKTWMLAKGKWVAENPDSKIAGFHLSSLYSPVGWYSWAEIVKKWESSQNSQEALKTFINTILGETWKEKAEVPEWKRILQRREKYNLNDVPGRVVFLTASIDVQGNRLECEVKGWGRNKESWSIDYRIFQGDPSKDEVWENLDKLLDENWKHPTGGEIQLKMLAIDSGGHHTQRVYEWAKGKDPRRVMVVKGSSSNSPKALLDSSSMIEMNIRGRKVKTGLRLWLIGTTLGKSELYSWLKHDAPTENELELKGYPHGFCHYPESDVYGEDFFLGLTAEQLVSKKVKGFTHYYWEKIRDRNEPLDLHVYNRAAATAVGLDRFNDQMWNKLESEMGIHATSSVKKKEEIATKAPAKRPAIKVVKKKSSIW
jgi:phage terminase large subunit GpA-like protein